MRRLWAMVLILCVQVSSVAWAADVDLLPPGGDGAAAFAVPSCGTPPAGDLHLAHHCEHAGAHAFSVPPALPAVPPGHAGPPPCGGTLDPDSQPGAPPRRPPRV